VAGFLSECGAGFVGSRRLAGKCETDNPYDDQTDEFLSWNDGFERASEEIKL
jgi:hypothetical protein